MGDTYNNNNNNNGSSYGGGGGGGSSSYGNSYSYGGSSYPSYDQTAASATAATPGEAATAGAGGGDGGLRRRQPTMASSYNNNNNNNNMGYGSRNGKHYGDDDDKFQKKNMVEKLDFMFPKVDKEFTVQTKGGGVASLVAYGLIAVLCLAELLSWFSQNGAEQTTTMVDKSLGKKMQVNINITFPELACDDLHLDVIDVAGDSQINIEDTLKKLKLHIDGSVFSNKELEVETNQHRQLQVEKENVLKQALPQDYCGPCYGAQEAEDQCCQTCDEVVMAYTKKRWKAELLKFTAEQCIREGRDKQEPKKMTKGQGCNLSGYMALNRVNGNFHIAMGEGIERDGRHIHTYLPEDAPNFNASHIIHQLSFGPVDGTEPLTGVTKIVTEDTGSTGLFQYFIKVVPTSYVGEDSFPKTVRNSKDPNLQITTKKITQDSSKTKNTVVKVLETNRYFFTERFMPLLTELLEDDQVDKDDPKKANVQAGHGGHHTDHVHHMKQNSVLPGVFFIYEIYPFAVEIRRNYIPLSHLIIRLMATLGGVFTIVRWADSCLYERTTRQNSHGGGRRT